MGMSGMPPNRVPSNGPCMGPGGPSPMNPTMSPMHPSQMQPHPNQMNPKGMPPGMMPGPPGPPPQNHMGPSGPQAHGPGPGPKQHSGALPPLDAQYMQHQSQIFVFSTMMANQAAEAVDTNAFLSIIDFHLANPETKKFLDRHSMKPQPPPMNRQNTPWMNANMAANMRQPRMRGPAPQRGGPGPPGGQFGPRGGPPPPPPGCGGGPPPHWNPNGPPPPGCGQFPPGQNFPPGHPGNNMKMNCGPGGPPPPMNCGPMGPGGPRPPYGSQFNQNPNNFPPNHPAYGGPMGDGAFSRGNVLYPK